MLNKNGPNENVCKVMEKIVELYGQQKNDSFRIHNMRRAIGILRNSDEKVRQLSDAGSDAGYGGLISSAGSSTRSALSSPTGASARRRPKRSSRSTAPAATVA